MRVLLLTLLLSSCATITKYQENTCFDVSFMPELPMIMKIYEVTDDNYNIKLVNSVLQHNESVTHKLFEEEMEKNGVVGQPCDELLYRRTK